MRDLTLSNAAGWAVAYLLVLATVLILGIARVQPATVPAPPTQAPSSVASPAAVATPGAEPTAVATPAPSENAAPEVTPSPSPPTLGGAIKDVVGGVNASALGAFLALLVLFVLIPGGALLVLRALFRLLGEMNRKQLVIDDIADATGDDDIKSSMPGISQEMRSVLHREAKRLYRRIQEDRAAHARNEIVLAPPPRKAADSALADFIKAIAESGPDQTKLFFGLLQLVFPAQGRKIATVLSLTGAPPRQLELSADVTDLAEPGYALLEDLREATSEAHPPALPAGGTADARALTALGLAYEGSSRFELAQTKYEEALAKAPGFVPARDGLARILAVADPRVRAERFIVPAARWLAVLLFKSEWLRKHEHGVGGTLAEERARIHNLVGIELGTLARSPLVASAPTYREAIKEFARARRHLPAWFVPYKNEADAVSYLGAALGEAAKQRRAISLYDSAIKLAEAGGLLSDQQAMTIPRAMLTQLRIDRCVARVLAGDTALAQEEMTEALGAGWQPAAENDADVLYTVACYGARLVELAPEIALPDLGQYVLALIFAIARDPSYAKGAAEDPDLQPIRPAVEAIVESQVWTEIDPANLTAEDVASVIETAVSAITEMLGPNA